MIVVTGLAMLRNAAAAYFGCGFVLSTLSATVNSLTTPAPQRSRYVISPSSKGNVEVGSLSLVYSWTTWDLGPRCVEIKCGFQLAF